ncbi:hypothetical protein D3C85_1762330 [compost metagenome]
MHHPHGGIGPKVGRAVFHSISGPEYSWKRFFFNDNPGVGLIIFQHDIVSGLMFFNETVFQQPGINFRIYNGESDLPDFGNEYFGLAI